LSHRLFLALDLPDSHRDHIGRLLATPVFTRLPVEWESPQKLHLTLNFLGRCDDALLGLIRSRLAKIVPMLSSFDLQLVFLETLYKRHGDSLIYLAPAGDLAPLRELQSQISHFIENELRIPQPDRFLPHVLIGRPRKADPVTIKGLLAQIKDLEFSAPPPFPVTAVSLYESFISRAGAFHQKIGQYALK